jgi:mannose-6-phosphate isomerase-like protein (cupin superfamily)
VESFRLEEVAARLNSESPYLEFLRSSHLSVGVYALPAGGRDLQRPHREDEVYYVARGRARMKVGSEEQPIGVGSVVFVAAEVEHRFVEIEEDLVLLVFFAPPESSLSAL